MKRRLSTRLDLHPVFRCSLGSLKKNNLRLGSYVHKKCDKSDIGRKGFSQKTKKYNSLEVFLATNIAIDAEYYNPSILPTSLVNTCVSAFKIKCPIRVTTAISDLFFLI